MGKYIMALDAGTTSNRCIIFDKEGQIVSVAQKEFEQTDKQYSEASRNHIKAESSLEQAKEKLNELNTELDAIITILNSRNQ